MSKRSFSGKIVFLAGYLAGALAAAAIVALLLAITAYRVGWGRLSKPFRVALMNVESHKLNLPRAVRDELKRLGGGIENAGNPTGLARHDTVLVKPDPDLGYVLRENVRLTVYTLRSRLALDLDPPALFLPHAAPRSDFLTRYIQAEARLAYTYSTDALGHRVTLPLVRSSRRILMVGDSVLFGVGVNDDATLASRLQRRVGGGRQVINAGVGGYNGRQCFLTALRCAEQSTFAGLVYVACQNDFDYSVEEALDVLNKFASVRRRFAGHILVVFHTYLEYAASDIFLEDGLRPARRKAVSRLRKSIREACRARGFDYVDWTDMVRAYMAKEGSLLARFALYADHVHLSPRGNELLARRLAEEMKEWER